MSTSTIIFEIDRQIEQLKNARSILLEQTTPAKRRGRPPLSEAAKKKIGKAVKKAAATRKQAAA